MAGTTGSVIEGRYTLFTHIPVWHGADGSIHTDALWQRDLEAHLAYLPGFQLCCPVIAGPEGGEAAPVAGLAPERVLPLRRDGGWGSVLANLLPNALAMARAVWRSDIVHSGTAGWAYPHSYFILLLRPFRRFRWIVLMESSPWAIEGGAEAFGKASLRQRLAHRLNGFLTRRCLRAADIRIFTHDGYRRDYYGGTERTLVAPAVWVDAAQLVPEDTLEERLAARAGGPIRLLVPARMTADKGLETILAGIDRAAPALAGRGQALELDFIGAGEMAERVAAFAETPRDGIATRFHAPLPYGAPFFDVMGRYDAILIANRRAEQPRIVYDAFAQGLPCLTTRTPGTEGIVTEGLTGRFFAIDDADALAALLVEAAAMRPALPAMAKAARAAAAARSHGAMHAERATFLTENLAR
ncbi:MAG: glycosyltransferase [Pseudomonadota bacterium]